MVRRTKSSKRWLDAEVILDARVSEIVTIEEIIKWMPPYKNGSAPFGKTIAAALSHRLEIVERGPNGSLGKGARFKILPRTFVKRTNPFGEGFKLEMEERMRGRKLDAEKDSEDRARRALRPRRRSVDGGDGSRSRVQQLREGVVAPVSAKITVGMTMRIECGPGKDLTWVLFWKSGTVLVMRSEKLDEHLVLEVHRTTKKARSSIMARKLNGELVDQKVWHP